MRRTLPRSILDTVVFVALLSPICVALVWFAEHLRSQQWSGVRYRSYFGANFTARGNSLIPRSRDKERL
jgi:hypothetical protein